MSHYIKVWSAHWSTGQACKNRMTGGEGDTEKYFFAEKKFQKKFFQCTADQLRSTWQPPHKREPATEKNLIKTKTHNTLCICIYPCIKQPKHRRKTGAESNKQHISDRIKQRPPEIAIITATRRKYNRIDQRTTSSTNEAQTAFYDCLRAMK